VVNWVAKSAWNGSSTTYPKLAFADLDGDGDKDLLIGAGDGRSRGYENTGTVSSPSWVAKSAWDVPDVGDYAAPALADLDGDGDYDLIVGIFTGGTYAYENTGTVSSPVWTRKSAWDVTGGGMFSTPAFADLDNDGKIDFLLGSDGGAALGYRNTGTVNSPAWTATPAWNGPSGTFAAIALADLDGDSDRD
jgi:hypothetical protein